MTNEKTFEDSLNNLMALLEISNRTYTLKFNYAKPNLKTYIDTINIFYKTIGEMNQTEDFFIFFSLFKELRSKKRIFTEVHFRKINQTFQCQKYFKAYEDGYKNILEQAEIKLASYKNAIDQVAAFNFQKTIKEVVYSSKLHSKIILEAIGEIIKLAQATEVREKLKTKIPEKYTAPTYQKKEKKGRIEEAKDPASIRKMLLSEMEKNSELIKAMKLKRVGNVGVHEKQALVSSLLLVQSFSPSHLVPFSKNVF